MKQFVCSPEVAYQIGNEFLISGLVALVFMLIFLQKIEALRQWVKAKKKDEEHPKISTL
jgi:hypothetical protein